MPARALLAIACLVIAASCATKAPSSSLARAPAEARYAEMQRLAVEHATQEGLEASFGTREIHSHKILMKNCVVVFTKENTSVAAASCVIEQGKFTFRGTPVLKSGATIKLGDQETVITAVPKDGDHYEVTTTGQMTSFAP